MIAGVGHCGISDGEYEAPTALWDEKKPVACFGWLKTAALNSLAWKVYPSNKDD